MTETELADIEARALAGRARDDAWVPLTLTEQLDWARQAQQDIAALVAEVRRLLGHRDELLHACEWLVEMIPQSKSNARTPYWTDADFEEFWNRVKNARDAVARAKGKCVACRGSGVDRYRRTCRECRGSGEPSEGQTT